MSVEVNIIFREKQRRSSCRQKPVAGDRFRWSMTAGSDVPVKVGIRGSRNIEIIGDVSKGDPVPPARTDLATDRICIDNSLTEPWSLAAVSEPTDQPGAHLRLPWSPRSPRRLRDPDDAVISAAMTAHIDLSSMTRVATSSATAGSRRETSIQHRMTHVSSRVRQTLVGMAGVSMGVGFTIMMAA